MRWRHGERTAEQRGGVSRVQVVLGAWQSCARPAGAAKRQTGGGRGQTGVVLLLPCAGGIRSDAEHASEWKERDEDEGCFVIRQKFRDLAVI